jgi:hypothetical protein
MNSSAAPRVTSARGTGLWFVASGTHLKGPFTFEELVIELDSGRVTPGDFCWRQGFQEWRPLCSVDEFGISRDRPTLLSPYPSVPLPSTGRVGRRSTDRPNGLSYTQRARPRVVEEHRVVKLRVQKNSKSTVTWLERMAFFLFSILFAYLSVWTVTSEVEKKFDQRMLVRHLGRREVLGDPRNQEMALSAILVEPVYSSLGFSDPMVSVPVRIEGSLERAGVRYYSVGGWKIEGPRALVDWSPKKLGIDLIYLRQFSVTGFSDPQVPGVVRYIFEGEPNIFVTNP